MACDRGLTNLGQYEEVLQSFRQYDSDRNGFLSQDELHNLLVSTNRKWREQDTYRLFHSVDRDSNHVVDIREFLAYVFDKKDAMGGDHAQSDYARVLERFRKCDSNYNGTLDKREFKQLMDTLQPGKWDSTMVDKVWKRVDKDHSGEVSCEELLAYIFKGDATVDRQQRRQHDEQVQRESQQGRVSGMMQNTTTDDSVIVEFVMGPSMEKTVDIFISTWMNNRALRTTVKVLKTIDRNSQSITRVTARQGAVVFWDRATMMAHRDDPFETPESRNAWASTMMDRDLPNLIESKAIVKEERKKPRPVNRNRRAQ